MGSNLINMGSSAKNERSTGDPLILRDFDPYGEHFGLSVQLVGKPGGVAHTFVD